MTWNTGVPVKYGRSGSPSTMVNHGIPWYTVVYHGIPYTMVHTMVTPCCTMLYHGLYNMVRPRCVTTWSCHGLPWYGIPWYTMVYHGLPCLHNSIAWHTMFAGDLHTRTAVARLPLHQLDYLIVNWSIRVTHRWTDMTPKFVYSGPWL